MTEIVSMKQKAMKGIKAMIAILFALTATLGLADETKFANEETKPINQLEHYINAKEGNQHYVNPKAGNLASLDVLGLVARAIKDVQTIGRFAGVSSDCHNAIAEKLAVAHVRWAAPYRLVDEADGPVPAALAALGPVYRINDPKRKVPPFKLCDLAPGDKDHQAALDYCRAQGGRLPTFAELDALRRALSYPDRYYPDSIPNMANYFFWSSDKAPADAPGGRSRAFGLFVNIGSIEAVDAATDEEHYSARCVVEEHGKGP